MTSGANLHFCLTQMPGSCWELPWKLCSLIELHHNRNTLNEYFDRGIGVNSK